MNAIQELDTLTITITTTTCYTSQSAQWIFHELITYAMVDLSPYHNDESLHRRRMRINDSPNDESFTVYVPIQNRTHIL